MGPSSGWDGSNSRPLETRYDIDTYSRVATAKLYADKNAITAADLLRDRVMPFFDSQGIRLNRVRTGRGTEHVLSMGGGKPQNHAYPLYLDVEDILQVRTKANHIKTNGICERFHNTLQAVGTRVPVCPGGWRTIWLAEIVA